MGSDVLIKNWNDSEASVLPIYKELIEAGLRIWVFRYISHKFQVILKKFYLKFFSKCSKEYLISRIILQFKIKNK